MYTNIASSPVFDLQGLVQILQYFIIPVIFFYVIFAFVVYRQVKLLNKSFSTPLAPVLSMTAIIHFCLSILIALMAFSNL